MHGAGNDYVYIDARNLDRDWGALSVAMSDRHFGIGSDGVIVALPSDKADMRMRMFNADGSEGSMCGNGIRCLVTFALDNGIVPADKKSVKVETLSGVLEVKPTIKAGRIIGARVSMGAPRLRAEQIPVDLPGQEFVMDYRLSVDAHEFYITCVSMGNPHAVAFIEQPVAEVALDKIGPQVEHHPLFPQRVNFEIVNLESRERLVTRVWERGSGLTLACGTGACAVAVAARLHGCVDDKVTVALPGGDLQVEWSGEGEVILEGPVQTVYEGVWPE